MVYFTIGKIFFTHSISVSFRHGWALNPPRLQDRQGEELGSRFAKGDSARGVSDIKDMQHRNQDLHGFNVATQPTDGRINLWLHSVSAWSTEHDEAVNIF